MADDGEPISKRLRRHKDTGAPKVAKTPAKSTVKSPTTSSLRSESVPSKDNASNGLQCLTDECLQKVFERLDVESLCHMANVCKRFRAIAEKVFNAQHKEFEFKGPSCKNSVFRRVLCKFGHLITSIDASDAHLPPDEKLDVNAIVKYCNTNLEGLMLKETIIDCDLVKPLFSRLKNLDLSECKFTGNKNNLFTNCPNLEYFAFEAEHDFSFDLDRDRSIGFVVKKFPKLKTVVFECSYTAFDAFFAFLRLNPHVKSIEIIAPAEDIYIQNVVHYTKNVEQLAIHPGFWSNTPEIQSRNLLQLSKLKKLQDLQLEAGAEVYEKLAAPLMDAFAKDKVSLKCLNLSEFSIGSKEIKSILKLKTIKILSLDLVGNVTNADLVTLVKELALLENLQLYFGRGAKTPITVDGLTKMIKDGKNLDYIGLVSVPKLKIDKKAFDNLLKAAQSRNNNKKIQIDIIGANSSSFNVPENIQRAASKYLTIKYTETDPF